MAKLQEKEKTIESKTSPEGVRSYSYKKNNLWHDKVFSQRKTLIWIINIYLITIENTTLMKSS